MYKNCKFYLTLSLIISIFILIAGGIVYTSGCKDFTNLNCNYKTEQCEFMNRTINKTVCHRSYYKNLYQQSFTCYKLIIFCSNKCSNPCEDIYGYYSSHYLANDTYNNLLKSGLIIYNNDKSCLFKKTIINNNIGGVITIIVGMSLTAFFGIYILYIINCDYLFSYIKETLNSYKNNIM